MSNVGTTCRAKLKLTTALCTLAVIAMFASGGCGGTATAPASQQGPAPTQITRDDPAGVVGGLVFEQPLSVERARSLGGALGGDLVALYRTDYVCVQPVTFGVPDWEPEPSRFTYVDADKIRERRLTAVNAGLSPPITGWLIAES